MKKIILTLALSGVLIVPTVAVLGACIGSANDVCETGEDVSCADCQAPAVVGTAGELIAKVTTVGNWIFVALLVVAGIFLVYSGFLWIMGGSDPAQIGKAKNMLINSLIGVAVALLAKGLVQVIQSILRAK